VYLTRRVDVLYAEPPSAVRELAMTYRDQSSVRLQWLAPDSDGGREDLRYRVECVDCAGRGDDDVAYTPRQTDLRGTASVYSPLILVVVWRRVAAFDRPQFFSAEIDRQHQGTKVCRYSWHSAGSLGWPFPKLRYKYIFQIKYTEALLSNSTRKVLWFEIIIITSFPPSPIHSRLKTFLFCKSFPP